MSLVPGEQVVHVFIYGSPALLCCEIVGRPGNPEGDQVFGSGLRGQETARPTAKLDESRMLAAGASAGRTSMVWVALGFRISKAGCANGAP